MARKTKASDEGAPDSAYDRYEKQYAKYRKANQRAKAKRDEAKREKARKTKR